MFQNLNWVFSDVRRAEPLGRFVQQLKWKLKNVPAMNADGLKLSEYKSYETNLVIRMAYI